MSLVIDASVVVTSLVGTGPSGTWSRGVLAAPGLVAPQHLHAEVAHVVRRHEFRGDITTALADRAHRQLQRLSIALLPYHPVAARVWALRHNLTPYDAWYVALAETTGFPLATLDQRLAQAPGPTCSFVTPP